MASDRGAHAARSRPRVAAHARPSTWPIGRIALAIYLVVLVVFVVRVGLPADRVGQTGWILIGILAAKLGRPWREHVRTVVDWLPLLGALLLYDHTRGIADTLGMPVRVAELVDAERMLFGGNLPTVWLQENFYTPGQPQWWDVVAAAVYISHFVLPWLLAAAFYIVSRKLWWGYIRHVLLLSYLGLLTYILVPAAPPWYAAWSGVIDEDVHRNIGDGWSVIGLRFAGMWLEEARAGVNDVAALPSLHAGFSLLVSVALWQLVGNRLLRVPLALYPVAMGLSLVYSGEHYVVDVVLGWAFVAGIVGGLLLWDRRSSAAAAQPSPGAAEVAQQMPGGGHIVWPHQQPAPVRAAGDGRPDARVDQGVLERFEVAEARPVGDGLEQPVVRSVVDDRRAAPQQPADGQR